LPKGFPLPGAVLSGKSRLEKKKERRFKEGNRGKVQLVEKGEELRLHHCPVMLGIRLERRRRGGSRRGRRVTGKKVVGKEEEDARAGPLTIRGRIPPHSRKWGEYEEGGKGPLAGKKIRVSPTVC